MTTIRAAVMPAPHAPIEIREFREPELEPGAALLDVECSEVCGTDVHLHHGRLSGVPYPLIPGHVTVGRLEKIRGPLRDIGGRLLEEGDRVTFLDVHRTCHACWFCLVAKASTRCPERRVYGITYGAADGLHGGWAEKLLLLPGTHVIRLGDVDAATFMAGGCSLPTALHAMERARIGLMDDVLVLGSGPVGLASLILSRASGAGRVFCIGAPAARLETARAVGAADVLEFSTIDLGARRSWVMERTEGRGADVVIEATGSPGAVVDAFEYARDGGRVVVVGQYTDHGEVPFNPHRQLNRKHLDVHGCWGSDYSHFHRAVRVMNHDQTAAPFGRVPLRSFGLGDVGSALDAVASGRIVKALVEPKK